MDKVANFQVTVRTGIKSVYFIHILMGKHLHQLGLFNVVMFKLKHLAQIWSPQLNRL